MGTIILLSPAFQQESFNHPSSIAIHHNVQH